MKPFIRLTKKREPRLPICEMRGEFAITQSAVDATAALLPSYRGPDGDHEGIVFLAGYEMSDVTLFTTAIAPDADHGWGHVICSEEVVGATARAARAYGLAVLAQVHTHGGDWTEHSRGDDSLIVMPFEGMLSLIAPHYGRFGLLPLHGLGVHQYQDGEWVAIAESSTRERFHVVPDRLDLR